MNYVGYPAAATLGFVHGNTRGAIAAAKAYHKFHTMPRTKSNPKRKHTGDNGNLSKKRRLSAVSASAFYAPPLKVRKTNLPSGSVSNVSARTVGSSVRLARVVKREHQPTVKRRKTVKVSKQFRLKTNQVIAAKKVRGIFVTEQIEVIQVGVNGNVQDWGVLPNSNAVDPFMRGKLFGLTRVLHVASRCWNQKFANAIPAVSDPQNFGAPTDATALTNYDFEVRKQWWEFQLKNNTHKTLTIKIHQCGHKKMGNYDAPLETLKEAITFNTGNDDLKSNITMVDERTSLIKPEFFQEFKNLYSIKTIVVILEPGQEYSFNVQGPSMTYDAKKYFSQRITSDTDPIYNEAQKNDISLLWQIHTDVAGSFSDLGPTNAFGFSKIPSGAGINDTHRLIVKSQYHCSLLMPEQTGFKTDAVPGVGTTRVLGLRKPITVLDDFKERNDTLFANTGRVDPVEPVQH